MERHFDDDLKKFYDDLLKIAALTEQMIDNSIKALQSRDKVLAQSVIDDDEAIARDAFLNTDNVEKLEDGRFMIVCTGFVREQRSPQLFELGLNVLTLTQHAKGVPFLLGCSNVSYPTLPS